MTHGRTGGKIMLLSHTLPMRGNDAPSLVEIPASGLGDSITDGRLDGRTDGGVHNIPIAFF